MNLPRKVYANRKEEARDFFIGFAGFFIVNGLLWVISLSLFPSHNYFALPPANSPQFNQLLIIDALTYGFMCFINFGALIVFGLTRRYLAFGILASFAFCFAMVALVSLIVGACFVAANAYIENY